MSLFSRNTRDTAGVTGPGAVTPVQSLNLTPEALLPAGQPRSRLTLAELSDAIGRDKSQICRWAKRPGFPILEDGKYDRADVLTWIEANITSRAKRPAPNSPSPLPSPGVPPAPLPPVNGSTAQLATPEDPAIVALLGGTASAKEITQFAVHLASRRVAIAALNNTLGPAELEALKKSLQELRNAEADYIELEKLKGQTITRTQAQLIIGDCVARLIRAQGMIANKLATEISAWLADPAAREWTLNNWSRKVREFVDKTCNEVRRLEAEGVDALIAKAAEEKNR